MHKKSLFKLSLSIIFTAGLWLMPQSALAAGSATFTETAPLSIEAYNDIQYDGVWDETPYLFRIEVTNAEESKHNGTYALEEIPDFRGEPSQYIFRKVKDDGGLEINDRIFVDMNDIETAKVRFDEISLGGWGNSEEDVPLETNETFTEFHELISSINDYQYRWAVSSIGDIGSDTYVHIEERVPGRDNKFSSISFDFWYTFCDEVEGYDSVSRLYHNGECRTSTLEDATKMIVVNASASGYGTGVMYSVVDGERQSDRQTIDIYFPEAAEGLQEETDQYEQDIGESSAAQETSEDEATSEETGQECQAGDFGWLICPIATLLINVVDFIQDHVIIPFLTISPLDASDNDPVFVIWKSLRLVANSLLAVVFLAFIFAQVASINIDAYAIRKILPRLLIATIAIQISFYIVAYMVDITALIGNGVGDLVTAPLEGMDEAVFSPSNNGPGYLFNTGRILTYLGAGATLVGIAASAYVGTIFLSLLGVVPVLFMVFFTLVFRQVLVMLLAIVSPIAFALWVLPNTEGLFKKWWSTLLKVLFMYPLIVLLFAGGALVAATASTIGGGVLGLEGAISTVIALAAIIAPLAMIPMTFKFAGGAMSGFANMVQSLTQRAAVGAEGDGGIKKAVEPHIEKRRQQFASGTHDGIASKIPGLNWATQTAARPGLNKFGKVAKSDAITGFNQYTAGMEKKLEEDKLKYNKGVLEGIISGKTDHLDDPNSVAVVNKHKGNTAAKVAALNHLSETGMAEYKDFEAVNEALSGNEMLQQSVIGTAANSMGKTDISYAPFKFPNVPLDKGSSKYQGKFTEILTNAGLEDWSKQKKVSTEVRGKMDKILDAETESDIRNLGVELSSDPQEKQRQIQEFKQEQQKLMQNVYMFANSSTLGGKKQAVFQGLLSKHGRSQKYQGAVNQAQQAMRTQGGGGQGTPPQNPTPPAGGGSGQGNTPQNPTGGAGQGGGGGQGNSPQNPNPNNPPGGGNQGNTP